MSEEGAHVVDEESATTLLVPLPYVDKLVSKQFARRIVGHVDRQEHSPTEGEADVVAGKCRNLVDDDALGQGAGEYVVAIEFDGVEWAP